MSHRPSRRQAIVGLVAAAAGCAARAGSGGLRRERVLLLPPTADPERFFRQCIRCRRCGEVCTAGCIAFHGPWSHPERAGTPYIEARQVACNTCMACTQVCPTGALTPVPRDDEAAILEHVDMGRAWVDTGTCLSHLGRVCGVCHDACPFPGKAIRLDPGARPVVLDACVGCGRCEQRCPQVPAAIRAFPGDPPGPRWTDGEEA